MGSQYKLHYLWCTTLAHAEELFLPPAGKDVFPATRATVRLQLNVLFLGPAAKGLGGETGLMEIDLSGPTVIERSGPDSRGTIQTEIVSMSLTGGGGTRIRLDPTQRSLGEIQGDPENPFQADSFFDVFFEIEVPQLGVLRPVDIDGQPTPVRMSSTIGHIPPIGSVYFGEQQVSLAFVNDRSRGMHLTPETPTYSMRGCGGLPADAGGV